MTATSANWITERFGPKILTKPKTSGVPTASQGGSKKLIALYFSASWCPPCKSFSPVLIDFYNTVKDDVEVIFVSSDRDEKSFSDYYGKMPWLAMVPGFTSKEHNERQGKLANMFKIQGIPSVIILDAKTGNFVTDNARTEVMQAGSSEASKKALVQTWLSKEAVPVENAVFGKGGSDNVLVKIFMYIIKRPTFIFGLLYFIKRFLLYLERLGSDDDQKEL